MIPKYIPQTPFRKNMLVRMDIDINDEPILAPVEDEMQPSEHEDKMDDLLDHPPADQTGSDIFKAALEESYLPMRSDPSAIGSKSHDITTEINPIAPDTLLADNNEEEHEADMIELLQDEAPLPVASDYQEYYNEAAMKAKTRNKLPDSEFGLPRLRKYPLNDEKHVRQAVAMFKHCKDPKDRAELARRIFAKIDEMKIDIKIGKNSALYDYAPKALQEATIVPVLNESDAVVIYGMEKGMSKRTKEDKQKEHLLHNSFFYNSTIYMGKNHLKAIKAMDEYSFLEYFYPNFKGFNLYTRLSSALGRLGMSKEVYEKFGMRYPFEEDLTKEIGWSNLTEEQEEDFEIEVSTSSYEDMTWYHQNTYDDLDHVKYCLALYSIVGKMMNDPYFKMDQLSANHLGILTDWGQQVSYYYQLFTDSKEFSKEYFFYAQCLHDLLWNCNDNPDDPDVIVMNIFSMIDHMSCAKHLFMNINEGTEMISKEECTAYMVHELGMEDDMFLLPGTSEYPIINQGSIRMAMDMINQISADERAEYSRNLNRKYKEFGCTFSISVDHPYAKYADQNIIDHMNRVLIEGDTAVSDQGTSTSGGDLSTEPWYVRMDVNGNVGQDLLRNKELGPNDKTHPDVDFTRHSSVF